MSEYTPTHRCNVAPTCSWAQTPNLPNNCSWIPAIPFAGSWSCETVEPQPYSAGAAHTHIKTCTDLTDTLSPGGPSSTHTLTCAPALVPSAALQPDRFWLWSHLGLAWGITHWVSLVTGLQTYSPAQLLAQQSTLGPGWYHPPTGPYNPCGGMARQAAIYTLTYSVCPLTPLFSHRCSSPNHLNPCHFPTSGFFP